MTGGSTSSPQDPSLRSLSTFSPSKHWGLRSSHFSWKHGPWTAWNHSSNKQSLQSLGGSKSETNCGLDIFTLGQWDFTGFARRSPPAISWWSLQPLALAVAAVAPSSSGRKVTWRTRWRRASTAAAWHLLGTSWGWHWRNIGMWCWHNNAINHPWMGMVSIPPYFWWFRGWFMIALTTLTDMTIQLITKYKEMAS